MTLQCFHQITGQAIQSTIIESVREGKSVSYSDFKTIKLPIFDYNEQAEIAMYLISEKFTKPALQKGNAVKYAFRMPLSIKFE